MSEALRDLSPEAQQLEKYKQAADYLVNETGDLDSKTRNDLVRQEAIKLGIIGKDEFPSKFSPYVEIPVEMTTGVLGFAVGAALSGGNPFVGQIAGGVGVGLGSRLLDEVGDILYQDVPTPSNYKQTVDAIFDGSFAAATGLGLQGAGSLAGKALKPVKEKISRGVSKGKEKVSSLKDQASGKIEDVKQTGISKLSGGLTEEASKAGEFIQGTLTRQSIKDNIPITRPAIAYTSPSSIITGTGSALERTPVFGKALRINAEGIKVMANNYAKNVFHPKIKKTPIEVDTLIASGGQKFFRETDTRIAEVYKQADNVMKDYKFDMNILKDEIEKSLPRKIQVSKNKVKRDVTTEEQINKGFADYLNKQYDKIVSSNSKEYTFDEVENLMFSFKTFAKELNAYEPDAATRAGRVTSFRIAEKMQDAIEKKYLGRKSQHIDKTKFANAVSQREAANEQFADFMKLVGGYEAGIISQASGKGLRSTVGINQVSKERLHNLYNKAFGEQDDIVALKELKTILGLEKFITLRDMYFDKVFYKHLYENVGGATKLKTGFNPKNLLDELGLSGSTKSPSAKLEKTKFLLKNHPASIDDLEGFINTLAILPEGNSVNTFITRSLFLRFASGINPMAVIGSLGLAGAAGGLSAALGTAGIMYALGYVLAQPSLKPLLAQAAKNTTKGQQYQQMLAARFNAIFDRLSKRFEAKIPPSALTPVATVPATQAITDNQE